MKSCPVSLSAGTKTLIHTTATKCCGAGKDTEGINGTVALGAHGLFPSWCSKCGDAYGIFVAKRVLGTEETGKRSESMGQLLREGPKRNQETNTSPRT